MVRTRIALAAITLALVLGIAAVQARGVARAAHQGDRVPFDTSEWRTDFSKHKEGI